VLNAFSLPPAATDIYDFQLLESQEEKEQETGVRSPINQKKGKKKRGVPNIYVYGHAI
jgi:hypothetical protein